jgi:uncharacterized protein YjeT (DUF2065 family)
MKNLLLIVLLFVSINVVGQEPSPTPINKQPTAAELKQAKETLKSLMDETTGTRPVQQENKSVADVLDKGVDLFSGYVTTLEGVVSKYAPEVWRIMITQQYAKAISYPLFWGLMLIGLCIFYRTGRKYFGLEKGQAVFRAEEGTYLDDEDAPRVILVGVIPLILGVIFTARFFFVLSESIMIAINPEYYALKDIIGLLR